VGYRIDGTVVDTPPLLSQQFGDCVAVYEELPGWKESSVGATRYEELPENARRYLERLQELLGVPIDLISTGPDRRQTIVRRHPFA
jgi:adenylosuccinate synthase